MSGRSSGTWMELALAVLERGLKDSLFMRLEMLLLPMPVGLTGLRLLPSSFGDRSSALYFDRRRICREGRKRFRGLGSRPGLELSSGIDARCGDREGEGENSGDEGGYMISSFAVVLLNIMGVGASSSPLSSIWFIVAMLASA